MHGQRLVVERQPAHSHGLWDQRMQILTLVLLARVDGPANEGIQNQPSVSSPSFATLDNALHRRDLRQAFCTSCAWPACLSVAGSLLRNLYPGHTKLAIGHQQSQCRNGLHWKTVQQADACMVSLVQPHRTVQPVKASSLPASLPAEPAAVASPVQPNPHWQRGQRGQAACQRVDSRLLVQLCHFELHLLLIPTLKLLLNLLHLGSDLLHGNGGFHLQRREVRLRDPQKSRLMSDGSLPRCTSRGI